MPAGPAPNQAYWAAFKELGDKLRLGDPSGRGFMALLDLQARIADELKPDYLLIDARTGVTELGGLATTILADTVVCMFVANHESLDGTLKVVEALKSTPRLANQKPIRVVPVVSRTTTKALEDLLFYLGFKRLLELGEGGQIQGDSALFALPHDDVVGASERVVGGEQKASDFSPLYKAYLELFQRLFPSSAESARQVLERLETVADIRADLTSDHRGRHEFDDRLSPWSASAIQEGVLYDADQHRGTGSRYADLLCRDEAGLPQMVVEYITGDTVDTALEFWGKSTRVRCAVLLARAQHGRERQIFTRNVDGLDLHRAERWDLPRPREFEFLRDVGDQSVESMLDAVRRGNTEAIPWLVNEWRDSTFAFGTPRHVGRWRPQRAQAILDGLAAIEDVACAAKILLHAAPGGLDLWHRERRFWDEWGLGEDLEHRMAKCLFAPLFWRLPVEAALKSTEPKLYPGQGTSWAGYNLLASDLMGLRYDPNRSALDEACAMAAQVPATGDRGDPGEDHILMWLQQNRREQADRVQLSDEVPPAFVWEEVLQEEPYWRGTLEEAKERVGVKVKKMLESNVSLRERLKEVSQKRYLTTQGLLGSYDASDRLELYPRVITAAAEVLGISPRYLKSVVFIHLMAWALARESYDLDGQRGFGFAPSPRTSPFDRESPTHVTIVQAFTDRLIRVLRDPNLQAAFEKLSKHQPEPYTRWAAMRKVPLEKLRMLLLAARASAPVLGLPGAEDSQ